MKSGIVSKMLLLLFLLTSIAGKSLAQKDKLEGLWYNAEKSAKIEIYKATDGKFWGKIIWLKEPNENGKPKLDKNNPKEAKRNVPILDLVILKHFVKDGDNLYNEGDIYDPKNGKTYSCKITYKGDKLDVRGYVGISMLGRTTTWERVH